MSHSDLSGRVSGLPPLLNHIILAAAYADEHNPNIDRSGEAEGLTELGWSATFIVPARVVLAHGDDDLYRRSSEIGMAHFGWAHAEAKLGCALERVKKFKRPDAIDSAHTELATIGDPTSSSYSGLVRGVTLTELAKKW